MAREGLGARTYVNVGGFNPFAAKINLFGARRHMWTRNIFHLSILKK